MIKRIFHKIRWRIRYSKYLIEHSYMNKREAWFYSKICEIEQYEEFKDDPEGAAYEEVSCWDFE